MLRSRSLPFLLLVALLPGCDDVPTDPSLRITGHTLRFEGTVTMNGEPFEEAEITLEECRLVGIDSCLEWGDRIEVASDSAGRYFLEHTWGCREGQELGIGWHLRAVVRYPHRNGWTATGFKGYSGWDLKCTGIPQLFDFEIIANDIAAP